MTTKIAQKIIKDYLISPSVLGGDLPATSWGRRDLSSFFIFHHSSRRRIFTMTEVDALLHLLVWCRADNFSTMIISLVNGEWDEYLYNWWSVILAGWYRWWAVHCTRDVLHRNVNDFQKALGSDYLKIWSIRHTLHVASKQQKMRRKKYDFVLWMDWILHHISLCGCHESLWLLLVMVVGSFYNFH